MDHITEDGPVISITPEPGCVRLLIRPPWAKVGIAFRLTKDEVTRIRADLEKTSADAAEMQCIVQRTSRFRRP